VTTAIANIAIMFGRLRRTSIGRIGAVVGAYNRFDPRDFHVFLRCLEVATLGEGRLRRELLESVLDDRDRPRLVDFGLAASDAVRELAVEHPQHHRNRRPPLAEALAHDQPGLDVDEVVAGQHGHGDGAW